MVLSDTVNDLIFLQVTATYISLSSNFALYLQHYLMDLHHISTVGHPDDLIQVISHCDLYFMVWLFYLYPQYF